MATDDQEGDQYNIPKTFQEALLRYIWPSRYRAIFLVVACIGLPALVFNINLSNVFTDKSYKDSSGNLEQTANSESQAPAGAPPQAAPSDHANVHETTNSSSERIPPEYTQENKCVLDPKSAREKVFTDSNFASCNFSNKNFNGYNFTRANLSTAIFTDARLIDAIFSNAKLNRADFAGAKLQGADFNGAIFEQTILSGANLWGAKNLTQQQLDRACGDAKTLDFLPSGLNIQTCPEMK